MTVSPTNTDFTGTFTFALPQRSHRAGPLHASLHIPIWLPATGLENAIAIHLKRAIYPTFSKHHTKKLEEALAFQFTVPGKEKELGIASMDIPFEYVQPAAAAGFRTLTFVFTFPPAALQGHAPPVTISYRQPSLRGGGAGQFFYVPVFTSLPATVSTGDTNRYSITVRAQEGCSLPLTNGDQVCMLHSGQSAVCSPKHLQAIQGSAWPDANPQGGANGRQPLRSATRRTSAAAASRRSP